jgi:hypothetical protein
LHGTKRALARYLVMRIALAAAVLALTAASAFAQTIQPAQPVVGPMQALGNIIRNPYAQPAPPHQGLQPGMPTAIPPNMIGVYPPGSIYTTGTNPGR